MTVRNNSVAAFKLPDRSPFTQIECKLHASAKRLKLLAGSSGIRLIIPPRCPKHVIQTFLLSQEAWLNEQVERLNALRRQDSHSQDSHSQNSTMRFPEVIELYGGMEQITCVGLVPGTNRLTWDADKRLLRVPTDNFQHYLQRWLIHQAKQVLTPRLQRLAQDGGFEYQVLTIRLTRSRWGSCSTQGNIMLSAALLLLAPELQDYVMWHELCHLRHPNHSAHFWNEVSRYCPDWQQQRSALKTVILPTWVYQ